MPRRGPDVGIRERRDTQGNLSYEVSIYRCGKRHYETFPGENGPDPCSKALRAARKWRALKEAEAIQGKLGAERLPEPISFEDAVEKFLAAREPYWRAQTGTSYYAGNLNRFWLPLFKGRQLTSIRTSEIQAAITRKLGEGRAQQRTKGERHPKPRKPVSRRTLEIYVQVLSGLFEWAQEPQAPDDHVYADRSPVQGIHLPEEMPRQPTRFLRAHELAQVLAHAPAEHRLMFQVLAYAVLRRTELYLMRWEWIDWTAREIHVPMDCGKRGAGVIPIARTLYAALKARHQELATERDVTEVTGYLFSPDGQPRAHQKSFRSACKAAGVSSRGVGYHTFRHTLGSLMTHALGCGEVVIGKILRHSAKPSKATRRYIHAEIEIDVRPWLERYVEHIEAARNVVPITEAA